MVLSQSLLFLLLMKLYRTLKLYRDAKEEMLSPIFLELGRRSVCAIVNQTVSWCNLVFIQVVNRATDT